MDKATSHTKERFLFLDNRSVGKDLASESNKRLNANSPCVVGNDVWIASGAILNGGVRVGNGAVIGAGAVITKDVEPYSIVVGVPAKKVKMRFDDETIRILESVRWWDWPVEVIRDNLDVIYSCKVDGAVLDRLQKIAAMVSR